MEQPKVCYIDCTDTFFSRFNTGIQRVVRNIVSRTGNLEGVCGCRFIPVITLGSEIFKLNGSAEEDYPATRTVNRLLGDLRNMVDFFLAHKNNLAPHVTIEQEKPRLAFEKILTGLHWTIVSGCRMIIPSLFRVTMFLDTPFIGNSKVALKKGDTYFFADSFWCSDGLHTLQNAKEKQAKIILLVYDIICVTHPAFFSEINCRKFNEFLPEYLKVVDGVISISKYSIDEIVEYCQKSGIDRDIAFDYFHLGADFASKILSDEPHNQLVTGLGKENYFLMVGTIEPRKNHIFVLDAFERLWQEGSDVKLCIVGKVGWKCDDIVKRMTTSKYFNKNLFVFNELNDAGLNYLLKRSYAVIIASIVEGFGLPIVEAMYFQKTLLASDIPVFREIGGDYPVYFPLDDNQMLSDLILRVASGSMKSKGDSNGWLSWDESIRVLMEKVIRTAGGKGNQEEKV